MASRGSHGVREAAPTIAGHIFKCESWVEFSDPWRRVPVSRVGQSDRETVDTAVRAAVRAQPALAALPVAERARVLRNAAELVESRCSDIAATISRQTGKAVRYSLREVRRSAWTFRAAASAVEALSGTTPAASVAPEGVGLLALTLRVPVGVVGAITPFNAPFNLLVHKVAPAFAAGNATIIKPASQAALTAVDLVQLLQDAGAPAEAVSLIPGGHEVVQAMTANPGIDLFTFTGGRVAGAAIASAAGGRRVLLELGGNSPNIVHVDADVELAARECVKGGFSNAGQSCNSVQRVYVHEAVAETFVERVIRETRRLKVGDPLDPETDVGTLVDEDAAVRVETWITEAVARGGRLLAGGERRGATIQPTVVEEAPEDARLVCEEVFGPVIVILRYTRLAEAVERANASDFGLQGAIFTSSLSVAVEVARSMSVGGLLVNRSSNFRLDHLPYGGVKTSGIGREGPAYALQEMTSLKLIVIDPGSPDAGKGEG